MSHPTEKAKETKAPTLCEEFLLDETAADPDSIVPCRILYGRFCSWYETNYKAPPLGPRRFIHAARKVGMSPTRMRVGLVFVGIRLNRANADMRQEQHCVRKPTNNTALMERANSCADALGLTGGIKSIFIDGYMARSRDEAGKPRGDSPGLCESFLLEETVADPNSEVLCRIVYDRFCEWWKEGSHKGDPFGPLHFSRGVMMHAGVKKVHRRDGATFVGLRLLTGNDSMRGGQ